MSRLEDIKALRSSEKLTPPGMLPSNHVTGNHLDWLINRVEELEEEVQGWKNIAKLRQGKQKEAEDKNEPYRHLNSRYKQALEEVFNYALSFSYIEDLDESDPELFEFAQNISNGIQGVLEEADKP